MVTWIVLLALAALGAGYFAYGRFVAKALDLDGGPWDSHGGGPGGDASQRPAGIWEQAAVHEKQ